MYRQYRTMLRNYVKAQGLRYTNERDSIIHYCCELTPPWTAEMLVARAQEDNVSRATVFNTLKLMTDAHIVQPMKAMLLKEREYELVTADANHSLTQCVNCGRVVKFKDTIITDHLIERRFNNFQMQSYSLYVYGTCVMCRELKKIKIKD